MLENSELSNGGDLVNMKMIFEQLLKIDLDVIILMIGKIDDIDVDGKCLIEKNIFWKKLKVVKNGYVYYVDCVVWFLC